MITLATFVRPGAGGTQLAEHLRKTVEDAETGTGCPTHIVLLIHGIRDHARWANLVADVLNRPGIQAIPIKYGYFDILRFWFPILTRRPPIKWVAGQVKSAREKYPGCKTSVICHSFGTYIIGDTSHNRFVSFHPLILCGSVLPTTYPWKLVSKKIGSPDRHDGIINECGCRDIWPVLARALSWGYGDSGRHGFGVVEVLDRFHNSDHGQYFEREFVEKFWTPLVLKDVVVDANSSTECPETPRFLSVLGNLAAAMARAVHGRRPACLACVFDSQIVTRSPKR